VRLNSSAVRDWTPPRTWKAVRTIDAHAGGEPLRVIVDGLPRIPGRTILEKRRWFKKNLDAVRRGLMWEPRGHADMYGAVVTEPVTPDGELGVLFIHNEGLSTMCGHGIIALVTVAVETGLVPIQRPETRIAIDTPAGRVTAFARVEAGSRHVRSVRFLNVPSFVDTFDATVDVPGLGRVTYDLAFGGAYYAYVQAGPLGLRLMPDNARALIDAGMAIKRAVMAARPIVHPFAKDLGFLYGTILIGPPLGRGAGSRNVCIFAEGEVDRSPTGTGVSGRVAIHHARGELKLGRKTVIESIVGSRFSGRAVEEVGFGRFQAVIPEVGGSACITGRNEFLFDPADPFRAGFFIR
jgi:trans-L-3-hydroxyproline dehydratase